MGKAKKTPSIKFIKKLSGRKWLPSRWGMHLAAFALTCAAVGVFVMVRAHASSVSYSVSGNEIVNSYGQQVILHGVDRPSLEWSCTGTTVTGADTGIPASDFTTMHNDWNANAVRIPLNQDEWLPGAAQYCSSYQATVEAAVSHAEAAGLIVILDLHWSDQGNLQYTKKSNDQQCMPDENSLTFWQEVATLYKNDPDVMFELYNEPHPPGATTSDQWNIWQNGGSVTCTGNYSGAPDVTFTAVGMQSLVNDVRSTGAGNVVLAGGISWASTLNGVTLLSGTNIAYAVHPYINTSAPDGATNGAWASQFGNLSATRPVVATEFGDFTCGNSTYDNDILAYFRAHGVGYTAWAWYAGGCGFPSIITDAAGDCVVSMGCTTQADMKAYGTLTPPPTPNPTPVSTPRPTSTSKPTSSSKPVPASSASPSPPPTVVTLPPPGTTATPAGPVKGVININPTGTPSGARSVQYFVDGKLVPSGTIDTSKLSNGRHMVETKTVLADGKVLIQTRTIIVDNPQSLKELLVAAFTGHASTYAIGIVVLAAALVWFISFRLHLLTRLRERSTHM